MRGLRRFADEIAGFDLLLLGGGDLVRYDERRALFVPPAAVPSSDLALADADPVAAASRVPVA